MLIRVFLSQTNKLEKDSTNKQMNTIATLMDAKLVKDTYHITWLALAKQTNENKKRENSYCIVVGGKA